MHSFIVVPDRAPETVSCNLLGSSKAKSHITFQSISIMDISNNRRAVYQRSKWKYKIRYQLNGQTKNKYCNEQQQQKKIENKYII